MRGRSFAALVSGVAVLVFGARADCGVLVEGSRFRV